MTIPNSVTTIGDFAFCGCTGLTSMTIPNSVTTIGYDAFCGCTGLTSMTVPNSVTTIGCYAFSGCTGLTSMTIPNSVTTIGYDAFEGCTGLTSIIIDTDDEDQVKRIRDLLPEELRLFVIPKKAAELRQMLLQMLLASFRFTCPVSTLRGIPKLNDAALLSKITGFEFEEGLESLALKRALEAVPLNLHDFAAYKIVLEEIVARHITAYKLQNYIQILEKTAPSGFFSGANNPSQASNMQIVRARDTVKKIIASLQQGETIELSEDEQLLLLQRPTLLAKIPEAIQGELGINLLSNQTASLG